MGRFDCVQMFVLTVRSDCLEKQGVWIKIRDYFVTCMIFISFCYCENELYVRSLSAHEVRRKAKAREEAERATLEKEAELRR